MPVNVLAGNDPEFVAPLAFILKEMMGRPY